MNTANKKRQTNYFTQTTQQHASSASLCLHAATSMLYEKLQSRHQKSAETMVPVFMSIDSR